jgi:hypothetical protein
MVALLPFFDAPWPVEVALVLPFYVSAWVSALRKVRNYREAH